MPKHWRLIINLLPLCCLCLSFVLFLQHLHLPQFTSNPAELAEPNLDPSSSHKNMTSFSSSKSRRLPAEQAPRISQNSEKPCRKTNARLWSKKPHLFPRSVPPCDLFFNAVDNETVMDAALSNLTDWSPPEPHDDTSILELVRNCTEFKELLDFPRNPGSKEEKNFPLAFVFVAHRNAAQTVRLFRMLYQPQNAYCVTYDTKSSEEYRNVTVSLASCFPSNVYLTPNPEPIYYFGYSILHSVMECMRLLARSQRQWRYVQVVSWNDFPLRTNWELVKIFKILNGSQDSELMHMNTPEHFTNQWGQANGQRRSIPPAGLKMYKGSFATSMSREFVNFMLSDPISMRFYQWLSDAKAPEEFYWPTLVHNLQLNPPGGFPGECEPYYTSAGSKKPFLSRYQVWIWDQDKKQCKGVHVNWSCVYGIRDLPTLIGRPEFIAHKVYEEYQPALAYCLEEWHWQRSCMVDTSIVTTYYENLPSVQFHNLSDDEKELFVCLG